MTPRFPSSVRQPSHIEPPFKARSWCSASGFFILGGVAAPGLAMIGTRFSGESFEPAIPATNPQPVPPGMRAEITWFEGGAIDLGVTTPATPNVIAASIRKGYGTQPPTQVVQGFNRVPLDGFFKVNNGTNTLNFSLQLTRPIMRAPIHLEEGESAQLFLTWFAGGLATTWGFAVRWGGYLYPLEVEGEAGTIRQTAQDPGIRDPLGR